MNASEDHKETPLCHLSKRQGSKSLTCPVSRCGRNRLQHLRAQPSWGNLDCRYKILHAVTFDPAISPLGFYTTDYDFLPHNQISHSH